LAAGSDDDTIRIWDIGVEQGAVALGKCHTVTDLALAPQGDLLAVASGDGSVGMWDVTTRTCRWKVSISDERVFSVAFSPDAERLVCACEDTTVQILDARTGQRKLRFAQHEKPLREAVFSPNGDRVVSAGIGDTALMWDAETGDVIQSLWVNTIGIRCLAFHPDGSKVAAGTRDAVVIVWDAKSGERVWHDNIPFLRVWNLAWSPNGDSLAVARGDGNVRIYRADDGALRAKFGIPAKDHEVELTFSSDGSRLLTGTAQKLVVLWELPSGREVLRLTENTATAAPVAIDPNNRFLVTTQLNGTVLLWPATQATAE
jgi:WD40 repeat protein